MISSIFNFIFGPVLIYSPGIFSGIILIIAGFLHAKRSKLILGGKNIDKLFKNAVVAVISFKIVYAGLCSIGQYCIWAASDVAKFLIAAPDTLWPLFNFRHGYFMHYILTHWWADVIFSAGIAYVFYLFMVFLKKYRESFFEEGEPRLGFLLALIIGWPGFIIFLPLTFIFVVFFGIFRRLFFKEAHTTLGWPFIVSALLIMVFGGFLTGVLGLGSLTV